LREVVGSREQSEYEWEHTPVTRILRRTTSVLRILIRLRNAASWQETRQIRVKQPAIDCNGVRQKSICSFFKAEKSPVTSACFRTRLRLRAFPFPLSDSGAF